MSASSNDPDWFTVATFNTLGSSHTGTGGNKAWLASGPARTRGAVRLLETYGVDVVGLQEFQRPQYRAFLRLTGGAYGVWSPRGDTENAVAWRRGRFRFVSASTLAVPYFDGHPRRMPVVRLQDLTTGTVTTFLNVHNPADTRQYPRQGRWRAVAVAREVALVRRLSGAGARVVVTGDMNDRHDVYCRPDRRRSDRRRAGGRARTGVPGAGQGRDRLDPRQHGRPVQRLHPGPEPAGAADDGSPVRGGAGPCRVSLCRLNRGRRRAYAGRTEGEVEMARYPYFGMPPSRVPRPAAEEPALTGKRVILSTPEGFVYDMRAAGELQTDGEGSLVVEVLSELHWFEQRIAGATRSGATWPAHLVWVE